MAEDAPRSPYEAKFSQGATILPNALVFVESAPTGPLGVPVGHRHVRSKRSAQEKEPWKNLQSLEGVIEEEFVRPVHLGRTVAPFRPLTPAEAVLPIVQSRLLADDGPELDDFPGLAQWWRRAVHLWELHRSERSTLSLRDQLDYRRKLIAQLPPPPQRVVYSASGSRLAAARLTGDEIVEHKLYWAPVSSAEEGRYLCAILNSQMLGDRVAPLQSVGQFGPRDFDKYVFAFPFPIFDPADEVHVEIALAASEAERVAAAVALPEGCGFQKARRLVRAALDESGVGGNVERLVARLLDSARTI